MNLNMCAASAVLALAGAAMAQVDIPAGSVFGPIPAAAGNGLNANIWTQDNGSSIAGSRAVTANNAPAGAYVGTVIDYANSEVSTPLSTWLAVDAASLTGLPGDTTIGGLTHLFTGYIAISAIGSQSFTVESDDGFELLIGGVRVSANDGDRGFSGTLGTANFAATGLYPIELLYWGNGFGSSGLRFSLTDASGTSTVVPTGILYQVPTPGTIALATLGGLVSLRRKR